MLIEQRLTAYFLQQLTSFAIPVKEQEVTAFTELKRAYDDLNDTDAGSYIAKVKQALTTYGKTNNTSKLAQFVTDANTVIDHVTQLCTYYAVAGYQTADTTHYPVLHALPGNPIIALREAKIRYDLGKFIETLRIHFSTGRALMNAVTPTTMTAQTKASAFEKALIISSTQLANAGLDIPAIGEQSFLRRAPHQEINDLSMDEFQFLIDTLCTQLIALQAIDANQQTTASLFGYGNMRLTTGSLGPILAELITVLNSYSYQPDLFQVGGLGEKQRSSSEFSGGGTDPEAEDGDEAVTAAQKSHPPAKPAPKEGDSEEEVRDQERPSSGGDEGEKAATVKVTVVAVNPHHPHPAVSEPLSTRPPHIGKKAWRQMSNDAKRAAIAEQGIAEQGNGQAATTSPVAQS